jgi:hypothetical protein
MKLGGFRGRWGRRGKDINLLPLPGMDSRFLGRPGRSTVIIRAAGKKPGRLKLNYLKDVRIYSFFSKQVLKSPTTYYVPVMPVTILSNNSTLNLCKSEQRNNKPSSGGSDYV